jgi:hypothetical protein
MRSRRRAPVELLRIEAEDLDAYRSPELEAISVRPLPSEGAHGPEAPRAAFKGHRGSAPAKVERAEPPSDPAAAVWGAPDVDQAPAEPRRSIAAGVPRIARWATVTTAALGVIVATAVGRDSAIDRLRTRQSAVGTPAPRQPVEPVTAQVQPAGVRARQHARPRLAKHRRPAKRFRSRAHIAAPRRVPAQPTGPAVVTRPHRPSPRAMPATSASEFDFEVGP